MPCSKCPLEMNGCVKNTCGKIISSKCFFYTTLSLLLSIMSHYHSSQKHNMFILKYLCCLVILMLIFQLWLYFHYFCEKLLMLQRDVLFARALRMEFNTTNKTKKPTIFSSNVQRHIQEKSNIEVVKIKAPEVLSCGRDSARLISDLRDEMCDGLNAGIKHEL